MSPKVVIFKPVIIGIIAEVMTMNRSLFFAPRFRRSSKPPRVVINKLPINNQSVKVLNVCSK